MLLLLVILLALSKLKLMLLLLVILLALSKLSKLRLMLLFIILCQDDTLLWFCARLDMTTYFFKKFLPKHLYSLFYFVAIIAVLHYLFLRLLMAPSKYSHTMQSVDRLWKEHVFH